MPNTLGARLRQHREQRGIALSAIAEQTKIKCSLLEALEKDDVSHWPPGVFRRSWLRSYTNAIGFDADEAVRDFEAQHPDPAPVAVTLPAPSGGLRSMIGGWFHRRVPESVAPPTEVRAAPHVDPPPDLAALARVCSELGRLNGVKEIQRLLGEAAEILNARGLIAWVWDHRVEALRPAFVHGYTPQVVARLPPVGRDADNLTAAAFRLAAAQETASPDAPALVVPLVLAPRCAGVLAIEFPAGHLLTDSTRAVAAILAASIAQVVARAKAVQAQSRLTSTSRAQATVAATATVS